MNMNPDMKHANQLGVLVPCRLTQVCLLLRSEYHG